jgi:hypothetical protein
MTLLRLSKASADVVVRMGIRVFSKTARNGSKNYIDEWYRSIVKPKKFYEANAAPGLKRKKYFYTIDLQGRVFLGWYSLGLFWFVVLNNRHSFIKDQLLLRLLLRIPRGNVAEEYCNVHQERGVSGFFLPAYSKNREA